MATVKLVSPPGYGKLAPLDKQRHGHLGLPADSDYRWCARLNAVHLNAAEFGKASADYPIAFARDDATGEFAPVAVLGLRAQENLFVDGSHQWRSRSYLPAYVRRHPFCIAEIKNPDGSLQRLVCVQEDCLHAGGSPLFAADGSEGAGWEPVKRLLESMEGAHQQTRAFAKRLEALNLLVGFDALALPRKGQRMRLQGLFRVDEERLNALPGRDLRVLLRKGELRAIYAHLLSLENFARLMDDAAQRDLAAEAAAAA